MNLFRENKLFTVAWFGFILSCLIIVFSGKLNSMSRGEAHDQALKKGMHVASQISKNVNFLVLGEKSGIKLQKAKENNIQIITEDVWLKMLD